MNGLGDLFDEAEGRAARDAGAARLEGERLGAVHGKVRRAHARRAALRTSLVAFAVVALGAGVVYGVSANGGPIAEQPTPSASPSSSASPSPSPSDTTAWPGFAGEVSVDPHLPTASAITPEVWASAGPGWAVISYRETWVDGADMRGPQVIYLVSPQGDRYELANISGDTVAVLAWQAGSTTAPVSVQPEGDPPYAGMLNLVTGDVTRLDGYAPYIWSVAFLDADGSPIYTGNDATSAYVRIAPDGTQSAYTIPASMGAAELAKAKTGLVDCGVAAPFDDVSSLVQCHTGEGLPQVLHVWPDEDRTEIVISPNAGWLAGPSRAGDRITGSLGTEPVADCAAWFAAFDNGSGGPVPGSGDDVAPRYGIFSVLGAADNRVIWGESPGCTAQDAPLTVISSALDADEYAVLMPAPEDRPDNEQPSTSVTGVAVSR